MDKTCSTCKFWTDIPDSHFGESKNPSDEMYCGASREMTFGAYGTNGKEIITEKWFGCNQHQNKN
jgi:hypothetical protein